MNEKQLKELKKKAEWKGDTDAAQKDLDELRALMANEKSAMEELESYIGLNKVKQRLPSLQQEFFVKWVQ